MYHLYQSLPGFLNLSLNVCSPSQVLWDVYTEVLEAAHPLLRGPTDHKRSVGPLLSLPEVYNQLFSFAHVQRETVVLAPWCKSFYLIQVCGLIILGNEAQNHSIVSKFNNRSGAARGHAVMCVERVEQGAQDSTLWGSYVQGDGVGGELVKMTIVIQARGFTVLRHRDDDIYFKGGGNLILQTVNCNYSNHKHTGL